MIRTPRLLLRRARMDDLADLFAVFSDPRAMRYWDTPPHADIERTRRWLAGMVSLPAGTDDFIVERDGRAIGKAGCWRPYEIGFILHPDHWRQGLAHEALSAAIPHIFATLPAEALTADVDPRNAASLRLLAKLGFHETARAARTIRVADEWCGSGRARPHKYCFWMTSCARCRHKQVEGHHGARCRVRADSRHGRPNRRRPLHRIRRWQLPGIRKSKSSTCCCSRWEQDAPITTPPRGQTDGS